MSELPEPQAARHLGDIVAQHGVEVNIRHDGLIIWINVDGVCVTRIITNGFKEIKINDNRIFRKVED